VLVTRHKQLTGEPKPSETEGKPSAYFVDWISIRQTHDEPQPIITDGVVMGVNGEGELDWQTHRAKRIEGSFDTSLSIRSDGHTVTFSGNISRFGEPDNVFGLDLASAIRKLNELVSRLGLSPFTAGRRMIVTKTVHGERTGAFGWTGAVITRLDLTQNFMTGSMPDGDDLQSHLSLATFISSRRRRDLNRQLKYSADLKFVETDGLPNQWVDRIHELYLATHHKSDTQFERLNRDYFLATSSLSRYLLFFEGEELIGFAQTLCARGQVMHKYVGMDYERNRQHRLYFALFLKAIDICIRDGLTKLDTGVTAYDFKRHLGSRMQSTWIYYRHNNSFANALLRRFAFLLKPDEAELRGVEMPPSA
jgi:hypothetical protein